jgi:hypothetical protein
MANLKDIAATLAILGTGALVMGGCSKDKPATEVPAGAEGEKAEGSCGGEKAEGSCSAAEGEKAEGSCSAAEGEKAEGSCSAAEGEKAEGSCSGK